jgi:predicted DNA-binding ribbon-helix-helix protein
MCHVYASTDPSRYESITRSVRLQGFVTSVRLENEFWQILDQLAADQSMTTARFICTLNSEVRGDVLNLASLLRVTCAVYLHEQAAAAHLMLEPVRVRA